MAKSLTGYVYKGPIALLDGPFRFDIPCKEDADFEKPSQLGFNFGRYGHPLTPLTYIALSMPELKGDKRLREMSGTCDDDPNVISRDNLENPQSEICNDEEDAPFGEMPTPDDFE